MRANGPVPPAMSRPAEKPRVLADLETTRREMRRFRRRLGLTRLAWAALAVAAVLMGTDWMWVLPTPIRAAGLLALAGAGLLRGVWGGGRPGGGVGRPGGG